MLTAIVVMCLASVSLAQDIIIVTNNPDFQTDYEAFIKTLYPEATVTIGTFNNIDGDAGQYAQVEEADLVIIARNANSGDYANNGGAEQEAWNSLDTPILNHSGYLVRSSRFQWLNADRHDITFSKFTVIDTADTFFLSGVNVVNNQVTMYSTDKSSFDVAAVDNAGNGILVANTADGEPYLAYWAPTMVYYEGSGYSAGEWRVWMGGPEANFFEDLTDDGKKVVENAIAFLLGGGDPFLNFPPEVSFEGGPFTQMFWDGGPVTIDLNATVSDDEWHEDKV
jgi:hypothetical protein